jgi:hypothetical protein
MNWGQTSFKEGINIDKNKVMQPVISSEAG